MRTLLHGVLALSVLLALGVAAQPAAPAKSDAGNTPPEQHRGPPPEALAACKALASGAACGFTGPRGAMKGSCFAPEGKPLACRPAHGPQGPASQGPAGAPPPKGK